MISGERQVEALEKLMFGNFTPSLWVSLNYTQQTLPRGEDRFLAHSKNVSRFLNKVSKKTDQHIAAIASVEDIDRLHGHLVVYSPQALSEKIIIHWKHSNKSVASIYKEELRRQNSDYLLNKHLLDSITLTKAGAVRVYCPQTKGSGCGVRCLVQHIANQQAKDFGRVR